MGRAPGVRERHQCPRLGTSAEVVVVDARERLKPIEDLLSAHRDEEGVAADAAPERLPAVDETEAPRRLDELVERAVRPDAGSAPDDAPLEQALVARQQDPALRCGNRGEALIIYPEGTRMRDDAVHEFLPGVGMLALRSGAPVIPVGLKGSDKVVHDGRPGLPVVRLKVGPAVDLSGLEGKKSEMYAQAAARIREAVEALYESL